MNTTQLLECERKRLHKFRRRLHLPNYFKKIGLAIFVASILFLLGVAIFTDGNEAFKLIIKSVMLISLLLIVLAKEPIEDELVDQLRGQAFSFAFISGVVYAVVQPYVNYLIAVLLKPEKAVFAGLGDFVILWFMLVVYLCFFHLLKRTT